MRTSLPTHWLRSEQTFHFQGPLSQEKHTRERNEKVWATTWCCKYASEEETAIVVLRCSFRESMLSITEAVVRKLICGLLDRLSAADAVLVNRYSMPHLAFTHLAEMGVAFRDHERLFQPIMDCHKLTAHRTPSEIRMRSLQEVISTPRTIRTHQSI